MKKVIFMCLIAGLLTACIGGGQQNQASLQSKGLSRVFSNTTGQKHQFFGAQPSSQSNSHIHTNVNNIYSCDFCSFKKKQV